jgi:multidrug efflux pump subunit AcrA (membrane-fusion protein)
MNDIPGYFSETPGDCPKCGMKLVPKEVESGPAAADSERPPSGLVTISPERQQLIGVKSAPVARRTIERQLRAPAVVAYDEERQYAVTTRTDGWIEELFIRSVGRTVEKGTPLFTLYSPELVAAQEEFLALHRAGESAGKKLVGSARAKLVLLGMSDDDIATLETNDEALRVITVRSPFTGTVLEKNLLEGAKIMAGTTLYRIADLSTVWLIADFYESDAPALKTGMSAEIAFPGIAKRVTGRVSYIYPEVDRATRTLKVRFSIPRPAKVSIENRADVYLTVKRSDVPTVPQSAVIDTGLRRVVISRQGNTFLPMAVRTGIADNDFVELIDGPAEGSEVVMNAAFLIDSESSMRELIGKKP